MSFELLPSKRRDGMEAVEALLMGVLLLVVFAGGFFIGTTRIPQITPVSPTQLTITGKFSSVNLGTTASDIEFVSSSTGTVYGAQVSNDQYTITIPNIDTYVIKIHWSDILHVTSGDCVAGNLVLRVEVSGGGPIKVNWSC